MACVITASDMLSCLGDAGTTLRKLFAGASGLSPLLFHDGPAVNVAHGYQIRDGRVERPGRAAGWLARCVSTAATRARLDPATRRISVLVGTGLRQLREVERWALDDLSLDAHDLHFDRAVRAVLPGVAEVITVANACAASGYALALGADFLDSGEADAVIVAGVDTITASMLAMIGRVADEPATALCPFDVNRAGVLLGEGAAAVVLEPADGPRAGRPGQALLLGSGLSCDAYHETVPLRAGIVHAIRDAHARAGVQPGDIGLIVAHGTGTRLNDPTEAAALAEVFAGTAPRPLLTAIKGAVGHTSGAAALMNVIVAVEALRVGEAPPVVGVTDPIPETAGLSVVVGGPAPLGARVAQVNAFGFGGVNAVCVLEVVR